MALRFSDCLFNIRTVLGSIRSETEAIARPAFVEAATASSRRCVNFDHTAALTRALPTVTVAAPPLQGRSAAVLLIDIEAFDILADGSCVLAARWTIQGADRGAPSVSANGSVSVPIVGGMTDATIVSAMADAIQTLADHMAISVQRVVEPG